MVTEYVVGDSVGAEVGRMPEIKERREDGLARVVGECSAEPRADGTGDASGCGAAHVGYCDDLPRKKRRGQDEKGGRQGAATQEETGSPAREPRLQVIQAQRSVAGYIA